MRKATITFQCRQNKFCTLSPQIINNDIYRLLLIDRKSTRLNSSHVKISYAVSCLTKIKLRRKREGDGTAHCARTLRSAAGSAVMPYGCMLGLSCGRAMCAPDASADDPSYASIIRT